MSPSTIRFHQTAETKHVARSAGVVGLGVVLSRISGLVREVLMAHFFGAGFSFDAFLLAFRIPNLTRDVFAEGALSSAFIPNFAATLAAKDQRKADELLNLTISATIVVVGIFCLIGMLFAPQLVHLLAPGFHLLPGKTELAIRLTRIMFPFLLVIALAAQATAVLNTHGRFGVAALASTFFNIGSVALGLAIGFWLGPHIGISSIEGMAYGVVLGGFLQFGWQLPTLRQYGYRFRFALDWAHPTLRRIGFLMGPAILGNLAVQINVIINTSFASEMHDPVRGNNGPVSWLGYSFRFVQLPLGLFGVAVASAMLPTISRSAAQRDFAEFRKIFSRSLGLISLFTLPSSIALILLGRQIICAVYQSGRFTSYDTQQTALALSCYAIGLLAFAATRVLNPAFYALGDAKTPMYVSFLSIVLNIAFPLILIGRFKFGFVSLALTTSLAVTIEAAILLELLRRKVGGIEARYLRDRLAQTALASSGMAMAIVIATGLFGNPVVLDRSAALMETGVCLACGGLTFLAIAGILGIEEIQFALDSLVWRARRLFSTAHAKAPF